MLFRYLEHQPRVDLVVQFSVVLEEGVDYFKAVVCTCWGVREQEDINMFITMNPLDAEKQARVQALMACTEIWCITWAEHDPYTGWMRFRTFFLHFERVILADILHQRHQCMVWTS